MLPMLTGLGCVGWDFLRCQEQVFQSVHVLHFSNYHSTVLVASRRLHASPAVWATNLASWLVLQTFHLPHGRTGDFTDRERFIAPLFHAICLTWIHSKHNGFPGRMVFLLHKFCNLLIGRVRKNLYLGYSWKVGCFFDGALNADICCIGFWFGASPCAHDHTLSPVFSASLTMWHSLEKNTIWSTRELSSTSFTR
jgi:hypothetical protein